MRNPAAILRCALLVLLATTACAPRAATTPYELPVATSSQRVVLRSDVPIAHEHRELARAIPATEHTMNAWVGLQPTAAVTVYARQPDAHAAAMRALGAAHAGAATRRMGGQPSRGGEAARGTRTEVFVSLPRRTDTTEGDAIEMQFLQFQVAHELVHAWLPASADGNPIAEGLASFIADRVVQALEKETAPTARLTGPRTVVAAVPLMIERAARDPMTVHGAATETGQNAYATAWLLFEFAAAHLDRPAFTRFAYWACTAPASERAQAPARLLHLMNQQPSPDALRDLDAQLAAFARSHVADRQVWWAATGFHAIGSRADGTALLCDEGSGIALLVSEDACQSPRGQAADARFGGPPVRRVDAIEFRRAAGPVRWVAFETPMIALGEAGDQRVRAMAEPGRVLAEGHAAPGEWLHLAIEGRDLVLRSGAGGEHARWADGACSRFVLVAGQVGPDGRSAVVEVRAR